MAVRTITTRIALDGETKFKEAMSSVNTALRAVKSEIVLSETQFKGQANTLDALTAKNKLLTDAIDQQKEKVRALEQAVKDSIETYGEDSKTTDKYQAQLNRAKTELIEMDRELVQNSQYLKEARDSADGTAKSIDEFGNATKSAGNSVTTLAGALQAAGVAMGVREIAKAIRDCVDASVEFESAMASFNKVAKLSDEELAGMSEQIRTLSTEMPATTTEIAQVAEAAARLGIEKDHIMEFTEVMLNLGNVSDLSAEAAATALARFANIAGTSSDNYERLGSVIVALGNNFATSESEITELSSRLASAGTLAGLTEPQIMALAAAMSSVGIQAEAGGTAMTQTLTAIEKAVTSGGKNLEQFAQIAGMSSSQFAEAWQGDPMTAITAFIGGLSQLDEQGESATQVLDELGLSGIRQSNMLKSLALAYDTLASAQETANTAWKDNTELAATAAERYGTTEAQMAMAANAANNLKIAIGETLAPALRDAAQVGAGFLSLMENAVKEFPGIGYAAAGLGAGLGALTVGLTVATVATTGFGTAVAGAAAALAASPFGAAVLGISALVTVLAAVADSAEHAGEKITEAGQAIADNRAAWEEQKTAVNTQRNEIEDLAAQLEYLAGKENRTAGEKAQLLAVTEALNQAVPNLSLEYDQLNDTLNMTTEQILALTRAQADAQEQADLAARIVQAERDQTVAVRELEKAELELAAAQEALAKEIQNGIGVMDQAEYDRLGAEVEKAKAKFDELTAAVADGEDQLNEMKGELEELVGTADTAAGGLDGVADTMEGTVLSMEDLAASAEELEDATLYLAGSVDTLSSALEEQQEQGSLSLQTTLGLIDAGYAAALAVDEETGAVTLNREEYIRLASAKIQEQLATLQAQKAALESANALESEAAAARRDSSAYWDAAAAKLAKNAADKDSITSLDAQIAALKQAQNALGSYTGAVTTASRTTTSASRQAKSEAQQAKTQAEEDLAAYKELKTELDRLKTLELVSEAEYYHQLAGYRSQYLTDKTNMDEYWKVTEQIFKYDKALADQEAALWAEQTDTLIRELEGRVKSVTDQQNKVEDRLSSYGDLFEVKDKKMTLNSLQKQIDAIEAYEQALTRLKERGVSESLMDEVLGMDVDSATQYANQLLSMSEKQWEKYNALWDEKQLRAAEVAEQFFKDQLDALENEYNDKLGDALDSLTDTAFGAGENTAQGLIDGLASMEGALYAQVQKMSDDLNSMLSKVGYIPSSSELANALSTERFAERYQGVTGQQLQNAVIGGVNALNTISAGAGEMPMNITIQTRDGIQIANAFLPNIRTAARENPEVLDDT